MDFVELFETATAADGRPGNRPYPYQEQIAADGLPDLVEVGTGLGKTEAVLLPWLWRRRFHPDSEVRQATPKRLILTFPMRVLVEQTKMRIHDYVSRLGLADDVDVRLLLGGEPTWIDGEHWAGHPERDTVVIGTIDMVISRCLMRGYGSSRGIWPLEFGLIHDGSQFVFDEVQLLGAALPTARQLQGFRELMTTYRPTHSTFMSATVDLPSLDTVDAPGISSHVRLSNDDFANPEVARRVDATKVVRKLVLDDPKKSELEIAQHAAERHRLGTLSLVIVNTVDRASAIAACFSRKVDTTANVVLLHSRFRPGDRAAQIELAVGDGAASAADGAGTIVVSTQVVEAGVDISAAVMTTDVAPWSSLVQRAGRCNRAGDLGDAEWWWVEVDEKRSAPYEPTDIAASTVALQAHEGESLSPARLDSMNVEQHRANHQVLRRRDLLDLFDTSPDGSGNDIDVGRFIRDDVMDLDLVVAWRDGVGSAEQRSQPMPRRDERCPVPVREFRRWHKTLDIARRGRVARWSVQDREWVRCVTDDIRPGAVILVDCSLGGYTADRGWSPKSKVRVEPIALAESEPDSAGRSLDEMGESDETHPDPLTMTGAWVTLPDHLADAKREAAGLIDEMLAPLPPAHETAVVEASALHDVGKAHPQFQRAIREIAEMVPSQGASFAKSSGSGRLRYESPGFRHEFVSALWVLAMADSQAGDLPPVTDTDLVAYLVAAHHGKVRVSLRGPRERGDDQTTLGIRAGEELDELIVHDGRLPAFVVDLSLCQVGAARGQRTWKERVLGLLSRPDLGAFKLAHLEALVRLADWRASQYPTIGEVSLLPNPGWLGAGSASGDSGAELLTADAVPA